VNYYTAYLLFCREAENVDQWLQIIGRVAGHWKLKRPEFSDFARSKWEDSLGADRLRQIFQRVNSTKNASDAVFVKEGNSELRYTWQNTAQFNSSLIGVTTDAAKISEFANYMIQDCRDLQAYFGSLTISQNKYEKLGIKFGWKTYFSLDYLQQLNIPFNELVGASGLWDVKNDGRGICITAAATIEEFLKGRDEFLASLQKKIPQLSCSPDHSYPILATPRIVKGTVPKMGRSPAEILGDPKEFVKSVPALASRYGFNGADRLHKSDLKQLEEFCNQLTPDDPEYEDKYRTAIAALGSIFINETGGEWISSGFWRKQVKLKLPAPGISAATYDAAELLEQFLDSEISVDRWFDSV
jgi:hypothetical protein